MSVTAKAIRVGTLLVGATFAAAATAPAAADALGVAGAVGNFVGAVTGVPNPLADERLGNVAGHAGKLGGATKHVGGSKHLDTHK